MRLPCRSLFAVLAGLLLLPQGLRAQRAWEVPQDPCALEPGHQRVNSGMMHLKSAVEADDDAKARNEFGHAHDDLLRAIQEHNQTDNPAAWYWLGRYYVYDDDAYGADSAFRRVVRLAPPCELDVKRRLSGLLPSVRERALVAWQEGTIDSAVALFHLAESIAPTDAEIPYLLSRMYAEQQQFDSADKYVEIGVERAAGGDEHADRQRQAMLAILRGREAQALDDPANARIVQSRIQRDTLIRAIERDSAQLAGLIAEWSGRRLRPDVQQAVSRDSTTLAQRIAAARRALPDARAALQRDSIAAGGAFAPALATYERYLEMFPDDADMALQLLVRYGALGDTRGIASTTRRIATLPEVDLNKLAQAGTAIYNDGYPEQAIPLLEIVANRNPYVQAAQYVLARAYYTLRDRQKLTRAARQLLAIDPLNPNTMRMMAAAWDLAGNRDSVQSYLALADEGLRWAVTVTGFLAVRTEAAVSGSVTNITSRQLAATTLTFEFLDVSGAVLASATAAIPALEPNQRHAFTVSANVPGAAAWRYRRQ